MDASGHVKLADMGFCKELRAGERTYTTCGTADYSALHAQGWSGEREDVGGEAVWAGRAPGLTRLSPRFPLSSPLPPPPQWRPR